MRRRRRKSVLEGQEQLERAKKRLEALEAESARQRSLARLARKRWGPLADPTVGRPMRKAELETTPAPETCGSEASGKE